jgi:hypothetical protein
MIYIIHSILTMLIVFANITGCGVKGNPVMLSTIPDKGLILQNFKAASAGNSVQLNWDLSGRDTKSNYIAIEKSELGSAGNECRDCPRTFERAGLVPVKITGRKNEEYNSYSFTDNKVIQGKTYNYRLILCDDFNVCYESYTTEINFK